MARRLPRGVQAPVRRTSIYINDSQSVGTGAYFCEQTRAAPAPALGLNSCFLRPHNVSKSEKEGDATVTSRTRNEGGLWQQRRAAANSPSQIPLAFLYPASCPAATVIVDAHEHTPVGSVDGEPARRGYETYTTLACVCAHLPWLLELAPETQTHTSEQRNT